MSGHIGRGWNPTAGFDTGNLPPSTSFNGYPNHPGAIPAYGQPHGFGFLGATMTNAYPFMSAGFSPVPGPPGSLGPIYTMPANGYQTPLPVIPGQPGGPRLPTAHPVVSDECPALNLQNSTGGMGCEPGYNYYFPAEHTKIHVIKSREPPWRPNSGWNFQFMAYHVPVQTTLSDLMKGFGANNPSPKNNRITQVIQGGNGRFYKDVTFCAKDKADMKLTLKEVGWDTSRTGRPGEKPVVWLWVTKD
jgi:hypothetical protein